MTSYGRLLRYWNARLFAFSRARCSGGRSCEMPEDDDNRGGKREPGQPIPNPVPEEGREKTNCTDDSQKYRHAPDLLRSEWRVHDRTPIPTWLALRLFQSTFPGLAGLNRLMLPVTV